MPHAHTDTHMLVHTYTQTRTSTYIRTHTRTHACMCTRRMAGARPVWAPDEGQVAAGVLHARQRRHRRDCVAAVVPALRPHRAHQPAASPTLAAKGAGQCTHTAADTATSGISHLLAAGTSLHSLVPRGSLHCLAHGQTSLGSLHCLAHGLAALGSWHCLV